ncbi:helix-turn-helix domain-containing protein [Serinibacter salmoneus]|uniref:Putative transcriptional regulator n=1 Tax=Serinibacter salmoneus TaxID=556530 RepID=A0A2A9D1C0_9MICO|nr:helix-turn-helix transcriptional regulator [Serinibacter salmoneus]PFG20156.1 putative transcriptional regulator [Serinibacter salmoneus]
MSSDDDGVHGHIECRLGALLAERDMTMTELSRRTGITMANLSILKNNHAKAVRMHTLVLICEALKVTPGEILVLKPGAQADQ